MRLQFLNVLLDDKTENTHVKHIYLRFSPQRSAVFLHDSESEKVKVAQSCPTLCDPMDCSPWNSPGQNTGVGSHSLLQGIFPTQGGTQVSCTASSFCTNWATREALLHDSNTPTWATQSQSQDTNFLRRPKTWSRGWQYIQQGQKKWMTETMFWDMPL